MLKSILEKVQWYDNLEYQGNKVRFFHQRDYQDWIKKVKKHSDRNLDVYSLIQNGKIADLINKAINNDKVVKSNKENLCIYLLKSEIIVVFNKRKKLLVTILHKKAGVDDCEDTILVNEHLPYKFSEKDFEIIDDVYVENFNEESVISFDCDEKIELDF